MKPMESLYLNITDRCNLNCLHCFNRTYHTLQDMDYDTIMRVVQQFVEMDGKELYLSGGEPFVHGSINEIVEEVCSKYPNLKIYILTNGTLIDENFIAIMRKYQNLFLQISIDGGTAETHDKQRGKGSFEQVIRALNLLSVIEEPDRVMLRMSLSRLNYTGLDDAFQLSLHYNRLITFLFIVKMGNAKLNWEDLLSGYSFERNVQ